MKKFIFVLLLLLSCTTGVNEQVQKTGDRKIANEDRWGFLILSDIHIYTSTNGGKRKIIPTNFKILVDRLENFVEENNIKFIVLLGDATSGNKDDKFSLTTVKSWWNDLRAALIPLMQKGIKIFPIAGNHDYYTKNHQDGYKYGWCTFVGSSDQCDKISLDANIIPDDQFILSIHRPEYYTLTYKNVDLFFLHAPTYNISKEQETWLNQTVLANKDNNKIKLALGHVALYTRLIEKPFKSFGDKISAILRKGNIYHYLGGHEHYFWDEFFGPDKFRQTIVGTSSGTYTFVPHINYYNQLCKELSPQGQKICQMEPDNTSFLTDVKSRKQIHKQMFVHIDVSEQSNTYTLKPRALSEGEIIPF